MRLKKKKKKEEGGRGGGKKDGWRPPKFKLPTLGRYEWANKHQRRIRGTRLKALLLATQFPVRRIIIGLRYLHDRCQTVVIESFTPSLFPFCLSFFSCYQIFRSFQLCFVFTSALSLSPLSLSLTHSLSTPSLSLFDFRLFIFALHTFSGIVHVCIVFLLYYSMSL